jgi:hypothetical protein
MNLRRRCAGTHPRHNAMYAIQTLLVVLHVAAAAAYFGLGLPLARLARAVAVYGGEARQALSVQGSRTVRLMGLMLGAAAVFALGAFFAGGGFAVYGPPYHASIGLMVMLLGVHFLLVAPAWRALVAGRLPASRIAIGTGAAHLLWLVILVLMFWNRVGAATA